MYLPTCLTDFSNVSNAVEKIAFGLWLSVQPYFFPIYYIFQG
jgi:hypothetical protein